MNDTLLTPDQKNQVEQFTVDPLPTLQRRARLLLLYHTGLSTREVAAQLPLSPSQTRYWRRQFQLRGLAIFPVTHKVNGEGEGDPVVVEKIESLTQSDNQPIELPFPLPLAAAGLLPDDTMAEAGRKTMLLNFAEMLSHEQGTRLGQDSEELHDMRVATRRMRAAFAVFEAAFSPAIIQKHLKGLRLTGRALGHARDMDVILAKAIHYLDELPPEARAGMQPLVEFWQIERVQARTDMLSYLDSPKYTRFIRKFNIFVQTPGSGARPIREIPPTPHRVKEVAPALIYARLEAVRAYDTILPNATIAQLHALRIEFKRFRYTVEFFREVLGKQNREIISELKSVQDHLGDLHDADVACLIMRQFLTEWDGRQAEFPLAERLNPQPILAYLSQQSAELHRLMVSFPQAWERFNRPDFRLNLALAVAEL